MTRSARLLAGVLSGLLSAAPAGCRSKEAPVPPPTAVRVAVAEAASTSDEGRRYSATLQPFAQVDVAFKVAGYVVELLPVRGADGRERRLEAGDRVSRGAVLARVRQADYVVTVEQGKAQLGGAEAGHAQAGGQLAQAQAARRQAEAQLGEAEAGRSQAAAQLAQAQASLEQAQLDFGRADRLYASGSLTKPDYDAAKARLDSTRAGVDSALAQVGAADARIATARAQAGQAEAQVATAQAQISAAEAQIAQARLQLQQAQISLGDTALVAPMDGVVISRKVEIGTLVQPGTVAFTLADASSVKAVFGVPDVAVPALRPGLALPIATAAPAAPLKGVVTAVSASADAKTRLFDVEVAVPNPGEHLRVGTIVTVTLPGSPGRPSAATVPLSSIVRSPGNATGFAVFVVEQQADRSIARLRAIEVGEAVGDRIAVTRGLRPNERVVTTGATLVADGQVVQIVP